MSSLLATKLHSPSLLPKRVQRPHLVQRLNEGLESGRQITLVSAPAGFGKTTCASEWVNALGCPVTWLSLGAADDDPGRFFAYLIAALQKVDASLGREIEGVLRAGQLPPAEAISTTLSNDIQELGGRFLLVLDDFQVIQDRFILQVLENLVTNLPQSLHLVLLTREDPPLPLARLRANNQLTEIRAGDLRFTSLEADCFLNEVMDLSLSPADIAVLENKTEGWIAGLQLAGLSVRDRADPSHFIATLSGSHRFILSYLTEEVLAQQPQEIQSFLLQTSILDRLSGDLCNAVTGRTDSHALLEQLFNANLFLIPLDDEQRWYRYHHLFADLLANRLQQTWTADAVRGLHGQASRWLAQNDFLHEAIKHALEGKDYERAFFLVEQEVRTMMFSGRVSTLKKWLEAFPEASFQTHPRLNIHRVWIDLLQGKSDLSEQALQEKENMLRALPPSPENDQLRMELMMVLCRFVAFSGNTPRAIQMAKQALARLPDEDLASRARAHSALAIAYGLEGHADKTKRAFDECLHLAQAAGNYSLAAHATVVMAMEQCDYGQLREAVRSYQSIVDMGAQAGQKIFFPAGQGYIGLASIYLEWNDLETAQDYLEQGMELCSQGGVSGIVTGHTLQSRLRQAKGDLEGALKEIRLLGQAFQGMDPAAAARQILLRLAMGDLDEAFRLAMPLMNMLDGEPATPRLPLLVSETGKVILSRVFLARGELERATQLLDEIQATAEPGRRFGRLIQVYLLRALVLQKQNRGNISPATLECFERALDLAEPEGYVLLFLEEGPAVLPLLKAVLTHPPAPDRLKKYARALLDAFPGYGKPVPPRAEHPIKATGLVEPLTPRELQVLQLVAAGDSNRTIADKLVITVSAVKKHTSNIYGKLNVSSRTQAVARARELGLLFADE
jgi:LuxR family maltose regulon positive regulatory protein